MGSIYLITNKINGKQYIGQTIHSVNARWLGHVYDAKRGRQYPINRAINKYGESNFLVVEIDGTNSIDVLNELEAHYIKLYNTIKPFGYNLDSGGKNFTRHLDTGAKISASKKGKSTTKGWIMPEETKAKIRASKKGKPSTLKGTRMSDETKNKLRIAKTGKPSGNKGKPMSIETKLKLSKYRTGKKGIPHTLEWKRRMSDLLIGNQRAKGKPFSDEHKQKLSIAAKKRIRTPDGKFGGRGESNVISFNNSSIEE